MRLYHETENKLYGAAERNCYSYRSYGSNLSSSLLFSGAKQNISKQHLRTGNYTVQLCTAASFHNYHDYECDASDYWFSDLWKRIWSKNHIYKHYASCFLGVYEKLFRLISP